ncbi:MAG TPA: tetratricopeptide repeat protein, partial [Candidatus Gastranaerophilaceae bacterium]|nr:tetratricopeptide repeat protein [Candidatus Gastranaerophilaceae bacterium]
MEMVNLDNINDLIGEKEFEQAKNHLQNLLKQDGQNAEILKMLGLCNINLGLFGEAKSNFETAVKYKNDDASSWFYLANCYDNLQEFAQAKNAYLEVIKLRENFLDAYKNLSVIYLRTKEEDKAIELSQKALLITQEDYIFYYMIGTALLAKRQMSESIPYLEHALELNPEHAQVHNNLGTAYLTTGDYQKSYDFFIKASKLDPKSSITYYNIGSILQIQGKLKEACEFYEKAYNVEPIENYIMSLAFAEYKSEQYEKAIKHYKILVTHHPEKQNFQYNLACCYEMIGEYTYAIGILDQLILLNPKSTTMTQKLAGLYLKINQPLKAKEIYRKIIAQGTVSVDVYYEYALLCTKTGDISTAETILKKVLSLNPEFSLAHKDLGIIFLTKRLFDYAKDEFEKALKLDEENPLILFEYANFLHATNDFQKAKEFYQKAKDKAPDSADVKTFSAINFIALNELENALECIESALKKLP